jgi:hypothetical protein
MNTLSGGTRLNNNIKMQFGIAALGRPISVIHNFLYELMI